MIYGSGGEAWLGLLRHVWNSGEAGLDERGPIVEGPPWLVEIGTVSPDDPILREFGGRRSERPDFKGVDEVGWVVEVLRARPWSTRAWVTLGERAEAPPGLVGLGFRIRGTRLVMTAVFRTQDAVTGHAAYLPLWEVQRQVAERLALPPGPLRVIVDMPYIYVTDTDRVAAIIAEAPGAAA